MCNYFFSSCFCIRRMMRVLDENGVGGQRTEVPKNDNVFAIHYHPIIFARHSSSTQKVL